MTIDQGDAMRFLLVATGLMLAGCAPSTDAWLTQLRDEDVVKRRQAVRELGDRSADAERVVPALNDALRDDNPYVRRDAAVALGKFGPDARDAVPALTLALKDKDQNVRTAASAALKKINPEAQQRR
jgi:HEAT repeat protein